MLIKNGIAEDMMVYVDYRLYRTIFKSSEIYYYELKSTIGASLVPQYRRRGFDPWVGKIPWRRKWQPIPVFLPEKSLWTEEPGKLQSMGSQKSQTQFSNTTTTKQTIPGITPSAEEKIKAQRMQKKGNSGFYFAFLQSLFSRIKLGCNVHNIKFLILTILNTQFSDIKYIHIAKHPSPPSSP